MSAKSLGIVTASPTAHLILRSVTPHVLVHLDRLLMHICGYFHSLKAESVMSFHKTCTLRNKQHNPLL